MKGIRVPGDKSKGLCPSCKQLVTTTWNYGRLALPERGITVDGVMLSTCDACGTQVALAQQSASLIKQAKEAHAKRIPVRLPRPLLDFARMTIPEYGLKDREAPVKILLRAMLHDAHRPQRRRQLVRAIRAAGADPILRQKSDMLISFRLEPALLTSLQQLQAEAHLPSLSQVLKCVLVAVEDDEGVQRHLALLRARPIMSFREKDKD
jgi:hypothetical protein